MEWVDVKDQLPEIRTSLSRRYHGILARYSDGRIRQFALVNEHLLLFMKNGPRIPTKFEARTPPSITHWCLITGPQMNKGESNGI